MNHLDYNYNQNYYPPGILAVNAMTPNPDNQTKFLCSIWNGNTNLWVDVHYQIYPVAMFILVVGDDADSMKSIRMDQMYQQIVDDAFRIRVTIEFMKKTGKGIAHYTNPQSKPMTDSDIDKKHLTNMTIKKLQETKMMIIDEFKMDEPEVSLADFAKQLGIDKPTKLTTPIKLTPIFQSAFPSPVPLKSNMSKITWNIKDYIPFDTFTIINNLSRDYAYN